MRQRHSMPSSTGAIFTATRPSKRTYKVTLTSSLLATFQAIDGLITQSNYIRSHWAQISKMDGAAAILSIGAIALHAVHVLHKDISAIKEAPDEIKAITDRLQSLEMLLGSLESSTPASLLQKLTPNTQSQLKKCFTSCKEECVTFHQKLDSLTKRSDDGSLHWVDRVSIGIMKQKSLQYLLQRLTACETTITASTGVASLSVALRSEEVQEPLQRLETNLAQLVMSLDKQSVTLREMVHRSAEVPVTKDGTAAKETLDGTEVEHTADHLHSYKEVVEQIYREVHKIRTGEPITNVEANGSLVGSLRQNGFIVGRAVGIDVKDLFSTSRYPAGISDLFQILAYAKYPIIRHTLKKPRFILLLFQTMNCQRLCSERSLSRIYCSSLVISYQDLIGLA
ncbi:unnamed protein product [Periconia digitata]|uniref:Azaphilone pigments biosynthesis cluster protein L N-terminal domain-containing protein n=1 Tax=Periconia digitata TaxID=1303443 RepID=A0A9W4XMP3_9PLEO|nr:unnamed protein product [Periconia digitata]